MPDRFATPARFAVLIGLFLVAATSLTGAAQAQSTSPAKACADRWNQMKASGKTGDMLYRDFSRDCMAEISAGAASASSASKPAASSPAVPTGPAATAAQPSIKQCAELWNEMKAKNQTGDFTYREFAQQCLAGTSAMPGAASTEAARGKPDAADKKASPAPAAGTSRTSVPSAGTRSSPPTPPASSDEDEETDREALGRCNGEWKTYKARHNLTGAKAWHVFMAKCLP
ncbi:hypothetical protein [Ancylobacter pratisalsi]|uniref:Uncharacterized protein n=1 Tax=Ancylobacter pratisalsi TaxID=1745854 RepID=A0A6P1YG84_9HYPH|nr:hypothetical protein [Ancylobacter pratisalsi]QIB32299.1 hypothetical protein G3A50_00200 [Ancylobacter pratisalsi]